jgi:tetratricopeptide (TPR) repeat protein
MLVVRRFPLAFALAAVSTGVARGADSVPSAACVEALRAARIAGEKGDAETERRGVETAAALAGCELPATSELLRLLRTGAVPAEAGPAIRARLAERLADPATPVPPGVLAYLGRLDRDLEELELIANALERRVEAAARSGREAAPRDRVELDATLAPLQQRLGRLEAARATIDRLLAGDEPARWRWEAVALDRELERWESAERMLLEMLAVPGAPRELEGLHLDLLARLGRHAELDAKLEKLAAAPSEEDRPWVVAMLLGGAWEARDAGRDGAAETMFRRALALDADCEEARQALLHLYGSAEERAAHEAAVEARRQSEDDPQRLFEEGSALLAAGDAATAIGLLERAAPALGGGLYAEPSWYNLGLAAYKLERWRQAADAFGRAAELNGERIETHFQRGVALHRAGACAEAIPALERTLELAPTKHQARYYLGKCHEALGDAESARRELDLYRKAQGGG